MKAAVGVFLLTAAVAATPAAADIWVFTERDHRGEERRIKRTVRDLRNLDLDDQITSLVADERWLVCTEPLFKGDCRVVEGSVPNLRFLGLNNRITSMRKAPAELPASPEPVPPPEKAAPPKAKPKPTQAAPAEKAAPPKAKPKPAAVSPKPAAEPTPPPTVAEGDSPTAWRSKHPAPEPTPPPGPPEALPREWWEGGEDTPAVEVFEKPNYQGRRVRLEEAVADLGKLEQPVGSLLVRTGSWRVCSRPKFRGNCQTLDPAGQGLADSTLIGSLRPETAPE